MPYTFKPAYCIPNIDFSRYKSSFYMYRYMFLFQRNHPNQLDLWRLMTLQKIKSNCHGSPQRVTEDLRLHHTLWRNVKPDTHVGSVWPDSHRAHSVWTVITWLRAWTTSSVWQLKTRLESVLLWKQTNLSHQRVNLVCIQNAVIQNKKQLCAWDISI